MALADHIRAKTASRQRPRLSTPKVTAPTMDTNRLAKELREIQSDTKSGVTVEVLGDNLAHMQGTLKGESRPSRVSSAAPGSAQGRPRSDPSRAHRARASTADLTFRPHKLLIRRRTRGIPVRGRQVLRESNPSADRPPPTRAKREPRPARLFRRSSRPSAPLRAPPTLAPLTERAESPRLITQVDIQLTNSYPFEAPKMRFITKVWHPNVSSANGAICLDILKDQWSPALSIKTAMLSLQALLSTPEPNDPQDAVVAKQYLDSYEEFVKHAKEWTAKYASENRKDEKEEKLKEMGFGEAAVRNALSRAAGDEQQALELLLTGL